MSQAILTSAKACTSVFTVSGRSSYSAAMKLHRLLAFPGFFGAIDPEVVATVKAAAQALSGAGCQVEEIRLPVLEQTDGVSILWKLQEMESRPEFEKITVGHEAEVFRHLKLIFDTPETTIADFVSAEQTLRYDALLCPVTPFPNSANRLPQACKPAPKTGSEIGAFSSLNNPFLLRSLKRRWMSFSLSA